MLQTLHSKGAFIRGAWRATAPAFESTSPIDPDHVVGHFSEDAALVPEAVSTASEASALWRRVPLHERIGAVQAFARALDEDATAIAAMITTEVGKPRGEAEAEAALLSRKIAITADIARDELAPSTPSGVDGFVDYAPMGVVAVVGPFNFPVHLSNGHIAPAIIGGNAVILKPSPVAPACAELYVRAWERAATHSGAPAALLSLIQGDHRAGSALVEHPNVDVVAFTGSVPVGVEIAAACARTPWKLLALEMGGKNAAIVCDDADIELATRACLDGAFRTTGQRCTATSRVLVDQRIADRFIEGLIEGARALRIGDPFDAMTDLGPLATARARDLFAHAQTQIDGLEPLLMGGTAHVRGAPRGYWVAPAIHRVTSVELAEARIVHELFGPEVLIETFSEDGEAVTRANATPFGLAMSVFTRSEARFRALRQTLDAGIINANRGTAGASSQLPFGGTKCSGNHRPAGSFALRYCVRPVATLVEPGGFDPSR